MKKSGNNYAFIDMQNIHQGICDLGWNIDWQKLHFLLTERYSVTKAFIFVGFIERYSGLYKKLESIGYVLVFKPAIGENSKLIKGNCDAELVLQAMHELSKFDKAVLVTSDGDFYCLAKYLEDRNKLLIILATYRKRTSALLKRFWTKLTFLSEMERKLSLGEYKRKDPPGTEPKQALSSIR